MQRHLTMQRFWMSKGDIHAFALVISFFDEGWTSRHVVLRQFEVHETIGNATTLQPHALLNFLKLIHHVIIFVKDEDNNLGSMATTL
jgi:hypothetical protein